MDSIELASLIRIRALRMTAAAESSHVGSCLSVADILAVLYSPRDRVVKIASQEADRDRIIVSKGHAAAAVYAALAITGVLPEPDLLSFGVRDSPLLGHVSHGVPGVEFSTGSLGHGLPVATGMAVGLARQSSLARVFCVVSDGELNEGSTWEAALQAASWRLGQLTVIVDANGQQGMGSTHGILDTEPLLAKWQAWGWRAVEVDGHDHGQLSLAMEPAETDRPSCVIARTTKGHGVAAMEDSLEWHYRSPSREEVEVFVREVLDRA